VPNFRYRALTQSGEIVNGTISAPTLAEVARRIEYLRLLPIETIEDKRTPSGSGGYGLFGKPGAAEITTFTRDLALLLKAGARLDDALELLAGDADVLSDIYRQRVTMRAARGTAGTPPWGWDAAYGRPEAASQAAPPNAVGAPPAPAPAPAGSKS